MTDEDDEFARIERENEMKKGQPYYFKKRVDDDDIQDYVRPWRGLTEEDKNEILLDAIRHEWNDRLIVEQIEAKLKEKNT
jgi:hypothetical protein